MKPDSFEAVAGELGRGGDARVEAPGNSLFVSGAFPGERVRARPIGRRAARLLDVLEPSPARRVPPCPIANECGGCAWMAFDEAAAAAEKRGMLARAAGTTEVRFHASPLWLGYRRRARLHYDAARGLLGYRPRRGHALVDAPECLVLDETISAALPAARGALGALEGKGELLASSTLDGASLLFAASAPQPPSAYAAVESLAAREEIASAALLVPGSPVASAFGRAVERHRGPDGLPLETPIGGFVQANAEVNERLSARVLALAEPSGARVVELFAGAGNLTVLLAREAASVVAVEEVPGAVECARQNLASRGLDARFVEGDAARASLPRGDVLVLDPPRRGFRELPGALEATRPARVILVSCDLSSLARELGVLRGAGYRLDAIEGFDMFPQTPHLEALARLSAP